MDRRRALIVLVALVAAGCGDDEPVGTAATGTTATPQERATAFCEAWDAAFASGDDAAFDAVLDDVPAELEEAAAVVREAEAEGTDSPAIDAAVAEVLDWTEVHCGRAEPGGSPRRVAPPVDASFDELALCGTTALPTSPDGDGTGMVLYGSSGADDPYDEPMLGLLWNPAEEGGHRGDGSAEPVTVRGQPGVAAPITVFQQTIVPELGTVVAWTEGDLALGLYGRGWPIERAHELVAIADRLEVTEGGARIPDDALPDGFVEVFAGRPSDASLVFPPSPLYTLQFQGEGGLLTLSGHQMGEDAMEAFRFLTVGVDEGDAGGRPGLVGNAWSSAGPSVATWREPDGLVVRIVGIGVPLDAALQVASASRELTEEDWAALVEAEDCGPP